jgi:hypothetical protein
MQLYVWKSGVVYRLAVMIVLASSLEEARSMARERLGLLLKAYENGHDTIEDLQNAMTDPVYPPDWFLDVDPQKLDAIMDSEPDVYPLDKPMVDVAYHEG